MTSPLFSALAGALLALGLAGAAEAQIRLDRPVGGGGTGGGGTGGMPGAQQPETMQKLTPDVATRLLQSVGYKGGEPLRLANTQMQGVRMDLNGNPVAVVLANCEGDGCASYFLLMDFGRQQISADFINRFNGNNRFSRLYLANNGNAILQLDGHLYGGVAPANVTLNGALFANGFKNLMSMPN